MMKWLLTAVAALLVSSLYAAPLTKEQLNDFADGLKALTVEPPPPPLFNASTVDVYVNDVVMQPGERLARVPVCLEQATLQTISFRLITVNDTAKEGPEFSRYDKWTTFHPGEQCKIAEIVTKTDFPGKRFKLQATNPLGGTPSGKPEMARATGFVYGPGATATTPKVEAFTANLPPKPTGLSLAFQETFANFTATDSGFLADGVTPTWLSRLGHGRQQFNGEVGWYSDPALNPGTVPWLVEDGQFALQAQHLPEGVPGAPLTAGGAPLWFYSAVNISTKTLFDTIGVGSYTECRLTVPQVQGAWGAMWLLYRGGNMNGGTYAPQPEIDVFETFNSGGVGLPKMGTTAHWRNASGGHSQYGLRLDPLGPVDLSQPHSWGFWWGPEWWVWYFDSVPYMAMRNTAPLSHKAYLKLTIAVGAAGGTPQPGFNARMPVQRCEVWQ